MRSRAWGLPIRPRAGTRGSPRWSRMRGPKACVARQGEGTEVGVAFGEGDDLGCGSHESGAEGLRLQVARALRGVCRRGRGVRGGEADALGEAVGAPDCPDSAAGLIGLPGFGVGGVGIGCGARRGRGLRSAG